VINFWATWCPHCREERPKIQKLYEEWTKKGVEVITILIGTSINDEPNNILKLMESNGYSFPVLLDLDFSVTEAYGVTETPTSFFIDSEGIIREIRVGASDTKEDFDTIIEDLSE
jgi:thiol-disulfide isomerase/thioredoxin